MPRPPFIFPESGSPEAELRSRELTILQYGYSVPQELLPTLELVRDTEHDKFRLSEHPDYDQFGHHYSVQHPLAVALLVYEMTGDRSKQREGALHDVGEHGGRDHVPLEDFDFSSFKEVGCSEESIATLGIVSHFKPPPEASQREKDFSRELYRDDILESEDASIIKIPDLFVNRYGWPFSRKVRRENPGKQSVYEEWDLFISLFEKKYDFTMYDPKLVAEIQERDNQILAELVNAKHEIMRQAT